MYALLKGGQRDLKKLIFIFYWGGGKRDRYNSRNSRMKKILSGKIIL
jgi:hypothetical protein